MKGILQIISFATAMVVLAFSCDEVLGKHISGKQRKMCFNIGTFLMFLHAVFLLTSY